MSRNVSPYFGVSTQAITQATSGHLATVLSFPMSSQLLTTYESSLVVSILVRRKAKVKAGLGGYATRGVSAFPFSRVLPYQGKVTLFQLGLMRILRPVSIHANMPTRRNYRLRTRDLQQSSVPTTRPRCLLPPCIV